MKRPVYASVLVLAALALGPISAQAASPEKVHEYFEVMGMGKMVKDLIPTITANMTNAMKQSNPNMPPDTSEIVGKVVTETLTPLLPQMQTASEKVYAANLTDEEVTASIAFYKTPVGQSLLKKMPAMMQQSMQAGQAIIAAHIPELQQRMQQELQQRHPELK